MPDRDMLVLALETAVDELTEPTKALVHRDDGTEEYRPLGALIAQVDQARRSNSGRGGAMAYRSKPPVWIDAVAYLSDLEHAVARYGRDTLAGRVRAWSAEVHAVTDTDELAEAVRLAEDWVFRARALLEPSGPRRLRGARCPACGNVAVLVVLEDGEEVWRPALEVDMRRGRARCIVIACAVRWDADQLAQLGEQIARQTAVEQLALEPEPAPGG